MEDRMTNLIIVVIFIIVIILAGIFVTKIIGTKTEVASDITYIETKNTNSNTTNTNIKVSDVNTKISLVNQTQNNNITKSTETQKIEKGYKYNNRFYYKQLNDYSKAIYDAVLENYDKLNAGNGIINIDYDFSALIQNKNEEKKLQTYYGEAINALNLDAPNLFYIDLSKLCLRIEKTTSVLGTQNKVYIDTGENSNYFFGDFKTVIQVEEAINSVETIKDSIANSIQGESYSKTKLVHDWIIDSLEYDSKGINKGTVYGGLIEKKAVCEGYAKTCKYILDSLGVENILVVGTATNSIGNTEDHMWNYVKIDDNWYALDCTWDDPIVEGGGEIGYDIKHRYFLIGSDTISSSHVVKNTISGDGQTFTLPVLNQSSY